MLAKNSASSRAIPIEKMMNAVWNDPAEFEQYGTANKGMQAAELMEPLTAERFRRDWRFAVAPAMEFAEKWKDRAAKQMVNRIMEPWMHMTVICTGTDWHNFYALRAHPAAQPEFQVLAYRMLSLYLAATPTPVEYGEWHLPLVESGRDSQGRIITSDILEALKQASVARCARVSYTRHDAEDTPDKNRELHDRLQSSGHMSPFEHQATPNPDGKPGYGLYSGCYNGWLSYRKSLPNENKTDVDLHTILNNKPDWVTL